MVKKICILSFSNITNDSRVLREVDIAKKHYKVFVIAYGKWDHPEGVVYYQQERKNVFPLIKYLFLFLGLIQPKYFNKYYWLKTQYKKALSIIINGKFDLVHANDWDSLPIAGIYKKLNFGDTKFIFDAHEYNLDFNNTVFLGSIYQKYRRFLFREYGEFVDSRITVAESMEKLYRRDFDWKFKIILNAPYYQKTNIKKCNSREIHMVHHGGALRPRFIEEMMKIMDYLDDKYIFHFYLIAGDLQYLNELKKKSRDIKGRILIHDPISPNNIVTEISQYDIGIPLLKVNKESYFYSLPNKFFDYIMAGIMIVVSPLPMMTYVIDQYKVGLYSSDQSPQGMANLIRNLSPEEINQYKKNSLKAAKVLNAETEMKKLLEIYKSVIKCQELI